MCANLVANWDRGISRNIVCHLGGDDKQESLAGAFLNRKPFEECGEIPLFRFISIVLGAQ